VTATGHEVITRFPADQLMVAGAHYFTVNGPLSTTRENEAPPSRRVKEISGSQRESRRSGGYGTEGASPAPDKTMAISVVMPALEMAQENGKLLAWRKKEGERVTKGEPLLEIETDKAVVEVEAPGDGILAGITADVGAVVPVGQNHSVACCSRRKTPAMAVTAAPAARASSSPERASAAAAVQATEQRVGSAPQISPKARRLAKELGVDVSKIRGTGPDGTITSEDVQGFGNGKGGAASAGMEALSQVARLMAERTAQSWTSVAALFSGAGRRLWQLIAAQERFSKEMEKSQSEAATITDLLIALLAKVLAKHPRMNASWTGEGFARIRRSTSAWRWR